MGKQTVETMVKGGKATTGPLLGPSLGPLKVNTKAIVEQINEKTKDMAGMDVPVKVIVDTDTKDFEIVVGTPPVSALIKKELNLDKGSGEAGTKRVGDLSEDKIKKIARIKFGNDNEPFTNQVKGTCRSMGVTIGEGQVTEEEKHKYEEMEKAKAAEDAAKAAAKAAKSAEGEAKPAEGEAKPEEAPKEEAKKEEPKKE